MGRQLCVRPPIQPRPKRGRPILAQHAVGTTPALAVVASTRRTLPFEHDYEQRALQWGLLHLRGYSPRISTLRLQSMSMQLDKRGWPRYDDPVAHIDHGRHFFRLLLMSIAFLRASGEEVTLPNFKIDRRREPSSSAAAGFGGSGGGGGGGAASADADMSGLDRNARIAARAAAQSQSGSIGGIPKSREGYQTAQVRKKLLRKAASSMPRKPNTEVCPASAKALGKGGGLLLLEDFDASARAAELMRLDDNHGNGNGGGSKEPKAAVKQRGLRRALWGMPLQLTNCSVREKQEEASEWAMVWSTPPVPPPSPPPPPQSSSAAAAFEDAAIGLHKISLPKPLSRVQIGTTFCLRIGPSRAPRQPDFALAQLWPCGKHTDDDDETGGGAKARTALCDSSICRKEGTVYRRMPSQHAPHNPRLWECRRRASLPITPPLRQKPRPRWLEEAGAWQLRRRRS